MPDLSSYIDFSVRFDLTTGTPKMILEDTSSYPSGVNEDITGYFSITSPDGGTDSGSWSSPDVTWNGSSLTDKELVLRLNSQGNIQAGNYTVVYNIDHPSYTPTVLSRTFNTSYIAPSLNLVEAFDVFTPELKYYDQTSYGIPGYAYTIIDRVWEYSSAVGGGEVSGGELDLVISSEYYDAEYLINFYVDVLYESNTYEYLSIRDVLTKSVTTSADTPPSIGDLVEYLNDLKAELDANSGNCTLNKEYKARYEYAASLLFNIKESCNAGLLDRLNAYVSEFLSVTNNFVVPPYVNTNEPILPYDCGCGGSEESVNIYNSNGTLTGDRSLNGDGNELDFVDLSIFKTTYDGGNRGFNLDFLNENYNFGNDSNGNGNVVSVQNISNIILLANDIYNNYLDFSLINGNLLKTTYQNQDNNIGLYLNFADNFYSIGDAQDINGAGYLYVDSKESGIISGKNNLDQTCGLFADGNNIKVGAYHNNNLSGLNLDFANRTYNFGQLTGGNQIKFIINDISQIINTSHNGNINGLLLTFGNRQYVLGQWTGGNNTAVNVFDLTSRITTTHQSTIKGIDFDFATKIYQIGQINGGNTKTFKIDDAAAFGFQFSGTGITQATTGTASGQYLKVKVGGNDYVIELKNPS